MPITYNAWAWLYAKSFDDAGTFSPRLLHEANVVAHAIAAVLVYLLLLRLLVDTTKRGAFAAGVGAMLFAIHPLQVESVAWISELRGLLAADFAIASMLCYAVAAQSSRRWGAALFVLSPLLLACATLCKPSVAAVPAMLFIIDRVWIGRPTRRAILSLVPHVAIAAGTLVLMRQLQSGGSTDVPPWKRPFVAADALSFYLGRLVWPFDLSADYSRTPALAARSNWFWIAWLVPVAIGIVLAFRPRRSLIVGAALFAIALLPVLGLVPFEFQRISTVADRYAYLALLGPAFAIAMITAEFARRRVWIAGGASAVLVALLAWRSSGLLSAWQNDQSLWQHAARVNPQALVALCNIADAQAKRGERAPARATLTRVLAIESSNPNAHFGMASLADDEGDVAGAVEWYLKATTANPADSSTIATANDGAGLVLAKAGRFVEAETYFRRALEAEPEFSLGWNDLGALLLDLKRPDEAKKAFERALKISPGHPIALQNLATACERLGDDRGGDAALNEALRRRPRDLQVLRRLADRAMASRRFDQAIDIWGRLLAASPGDVDALNERGQALAFSGRFENSFADFERAIALRPDLTELRENLAAARRLQAARPR